MTRFMVAAALISVWWIEATAAADPTPSPKPGYQIAGPSGPVFPGTQVYPPRCFAAMLACGFRYDPGTATWQPGGDQ